MESNKTNRQLEAELEATRLRLQEAEETLHAITNNELDAFVVNGPEGPQVFTLQGAERPYRTLMETMAEGALTVAKDGAVLYCNSRVSELLKRPLNEIIGASFHDFVISRNQQSFQAMLYVCQEKGCRDEFFLKTADGEKVPVSLSVRSLLLNDVECFCIVATDLTDQMRAQEALEVARYHLEERVAERTAELQEEIVERKRAEEALAAERSHLQEVLQQMPIAVVLAEAPTGRLVFGNDACERLFRHQIRYSQNEQEYAEWKLLNRDGSFLPPEQYPLLRSITEREAVQSKEMVIERDDGTRAIVSLSASPILDAQGKVIAAVGTMLDITDRKRTEEELAAAHRQVQSIIDNTTAIIYAFDLEERFLLANTAIAELLNSTPEQMIGKRRHEFMPKDDAGWHEANDRQVIEAGEALEFEEYSQLKGRSITWLTTKFPLRDAERRVYAVAGISADVSERKKMEEELRKSRDELDLRVLERTGELQRAYESLKEETAQREQLESQLRQAQKMEALGTLSGGIAHDFNNILAAIIGFAELISGHAAKGSRDERHVARIMEAGIRGRELVRQMLSFSRKTEQEKKPLRLSGIVAETVKLIRATTPATINIKVDAPGDSDLALADPTQMQQVIMNLCTNAAYAMREKGGTLDIQLGDHSVSRSNGDPHGIGPGLYVKLTVRDTGTGISPDIMDKIFDPFFTTKKVGEGTGLGLSVIHGIVKQHDGYITVASEPGQGSTFTVYFPKVAEELETDAVVDDEIPTGSERILFVDDEEALVEMGEDTLTELGYDVTSRLNGREALALFKLDPSRFDVVITDQTMPEMTGIELAGEILALRADMPIIMCTGFSQTVDAAAAKQAGIKAFAMKPLTTREIARTIRKVLDV